MRNLLLIARREYLEQIRGRAFKVTTILVPALFGLIIFIMYLSGRGATGAKHVVIASNDLGLATDIRNQLLRDDAKSSFDVLAPVAPGDRAALVNRVRTKSIDGFLWVDAPPGQAPKAVYESQSSGDFITSGRLETALNQALVRRRLTSSGIPDASIDAVLKNVNIETLQINREGKEVKSNAMTSFWKGYVMAILLSMTTMIYGMNVARSIIQEKTSRIFEVMLATAKPSDLLGGKLIGVGAVGLTQIAIWIVAAVAIASYPAAVGVLSGNLSIQFSWTEGILFTAYFVLGYLLYASLFAGLAASCETEQELQMYTPLAALPIWLSFALIVLVVNYPDSAISVAASLFPATAPIIMMLRMGSEMPHAWEFAASIGIMIVSIWVVLWISARLYRVGILMYGKRATLPELLRWLRYS
jgi:ABC-2 type transport system permease protein